MNDKKEQHNYNLNVNTPVLQIPELQPKFDFQLLSNSLLIFLQDFNQARILQQLHFWLNQKHGVVLDGHRWIWKSAREWIEDSLLDLSEWKIRQAIASLVEQGIIIREHNFAKHHGHNYAPKNRTYYYRINYETLRKLIGEALRKLGKDFETSSSEVYQTPSSEECPKTIQNKHQNKHQNTHIESKRKNDFEIPEKNSQNLSPRSPKKNNPRLTSKQNQSDKSPAEKTQDTTSQATNKEATLCYDRALGINPPEQQKNLQQRQFNWMPEGAWAINGKLDANFHTWLAQTWVKKFGGNIDEARANVLINFKKDIANIPIRWEQYRSQILKRYDNASIRMANGVELNQEEQKELINHSRAIVNPLPEEVSVVVNGSNATRRDVPKLKDGSAENPDAYQLYQPAKIDNPVNPSDLFARLRNATKGAECTPLSTSNAFEVVRRLANKFTMPLPEQLPERKAISAMSIEEISEMLQDPVLKMGLLPQIERDDRFEVFYYESGEVDYIDLAF